MCVGKGIGELAAGLVSMLQERGFTFATAESCTGGAIARAVVSVSGCSSVMRGGVVAYHNDVKSGVLGVDEGLIAKYGAVSEEVVIGMAEGVSALLGADCAVATSGVAGPGGGTPDKPVGTVWLAVKAGILIRTRLLRLEDAGRENNIDATVREALELVITELRARQ